MPNSGGGAKPGSLRPVIASSEVASRVSVPVALGEKVNANLYLHENSLGNEIAFSEGAVCELIR